MRKLATMGTRTNLKLFLDPLRGHFALLVFNSCLLALSLLKEVAMEAWLCYLRLGQPMLEMRTPAYVLWRQQPRQNSRSFDWTTPLDFPM